MTWQELGALGELTGALAAVALLGYIAYQIRQNSRLLEHNARTTQALILQGGTEFYIRFWELIAQDATLAGIWRRVRAGETIDDDETVRYEAFLHVVWATSNTPICRTRWAPTLSTYCLSAAASFRRYCRRGPLDSGGSGTGIGRTGPSSLPT